MRERLLVLTGAVLIAGILTCATVSAEPATGKNTKDGSRSEEPNGVLQERVAASFAQSGRQNLEAGRYAEAVEDFTAALSFNPNSADARDGLARAQAKLPAAAASAVKAAAPAPAAAAPAPAKHSASGPKAAGPAAQADETAARALASLKLMAESARHSLDSGNNMEAAEQFRQVLRTADTLPAGAAVDVIAADAKEGLQKAEQRIQKKAAATAAAKPAVPPAPPAAGLAPAAAPERAEASADTAADEEYKAAVSDAMRDVSRMMKPQTKIMAKAALPDKMSELRRRELDQTTKTITQPDFQGVEDDDVANLIKAKLLKRVSVNFREQPFLQAMEYIRDSSDVNILIDPAVTPNTVPVDFAAVNMELRDVLFWILKFEKLDYQIRHGAIFISNSAGLANRPITVIHDISDLTIKVRDFRGSMVEVMTAPDYEKRLQSDYAGRDGEEEPLERTRQGEEWVKFFRANVAPDSWAVEGGVGQNTIAYRNGKLVVNHTPEVQEQIRELLGSFRKARAVQVAILARFIEITENFLDDLGIEWIGPSGVDAQGNATTGAGFSRTSGGNSLSATIVGNPEIGLGSVFADANGLTLNASFLHAWQINAILTAVRKQNKGNVLTAPRVTCFNTQRAFLTVSSRRNFVRSYNSDGNPEIGQVNDGIVLEVQPFVSADRRYITLELIPQVNKAESFDSFEFSTTSQAQTVINPTTGQPVTVTNPVKQTIQLPRVATRQIMTTVSVPDGGTLMIGGLANATESEGYSTVPILGDLPLIRYLFTSRRKLDARDNLIILVTAHIIQQEED